MDIHVRQKHPQTVSNSVAFNRIWLSRSSPLPWCHEQPAGTRGVAVSPPPAAGTRCLARRQGHATGPPGLLLVCCMPAQSSSRGELLLRICPSETLTQIHPPRSAPPLTRLPFPLTSAWHFVTGTCFGMRAIGKGEGGTGQ